MTNVRRLSARSIPLAATLAAAVIVLFVYALTRAPGLTFIDAGELATVASTLGIAHPTGYPFFTIVAHLVTLIPFGAEPIVRLNMMAVVLCTLGTLVAARITLLLAPVAHPLLRDKPLLLSAAAATSVLLLAFTRTYWMQSTAVEVYPLHALLALSVIAVSLEATIADDPLRKQRLWMSGAFLTGLSFTNHMTTIVALPGILFLFVASHGWNRLLWHRLLRLAVPFLIGLSLYLYLPLRALQDPLMNWGNPVSLERLYWHMSGKQYSVWMFTSGEKALHQLGAFLSGLPRESGYLGLLLAVIGVPALWRRVRPVAIALLLMFVVTVGWAVNYDIHDIDSYFLLAHIVVAILAGQGMMVIAAWLKGREFALFAVGLAAVLLPFFLHYREVDESDNFLVEDYTANMFSSLSRDAIVLSYQWDFWVSASYYTQFVRGERRDVAVVDKELLRRSWYYRQLERQHRVLIDRSRPEIEPFLKEIAKFERNLPYSAMVLESRFAGIIRSLIERNIAERPVYVTGEIESQYTAGFQRVPEGLAFRLYADTLFHPTPMPEFKYRALGREGRLEDMVRTLYARAFLARAEYYIKMRGDRQEAARAVAEALRYDPGLVHDSGLGRYLP